MFIHHTAVWVRNLEQLKDFYMKYFACTANAKYSNPRTGFSSYFLQFKNNTAIELMHRSNVDTHHSQTHLGWVHLAICVGNAVKVDSLTSQLAADGYSILSQPRTTEDGYYESLVLDPEGNHIELTAQSPFQVIRATEADLSQILYLQKYCYLQEAELYNNYAIAPLKQTLDDVKHDFAQKTILKIEHLGRIIGSIRGYEQNGTCFIGKLMVDPLHQNQGLGNLLLLAIEKCFASAQRYELFTGIDSAKNLHVYKKSGYQIFKHDSTMDSVTMVFLEKRQTAI